MSAVLCDRTVEALPPVKPGLTVVLLVGEVRQSRASLRMVHVPLTVDVLARSRCIPSHRPVGWGQANASARRRLRGRDLPCTPILDLAWLPVSSCVTWKLRHLPRNLLSASLSILPFSPPFLVVLSTPNSRAFVTVTSSCPVWKAFNFVSVKTQSLALVLPLSVQ